MEYLKQVQAISNSNNITTIRLTTNKRQEDIRIPYTIYTHPKGISYNYSLSVFDHCKLRGIDTTRYLKGASWEV